MTITEKYAPQVHMSMNPLLKSARVSRVSQVKIVCILSTLMDIIDFNIAEKQHQLF